MAKILLRRVAVFNGDQLHTSQVSLGAGAVLLPLVRPELEAVARRARQRRPVDAEAAQQVVHLQARRSYFLLLLF